MQEKYAALYVRVSTDAQFEEGYSVEAQIEMLEGYCKAKQIKAISHTLTEDILAVILTDQKYSI